MPVFTSSSGIFVGGGAVSAVVPFSVTQNPLRREAPCRTSRTERGIWEERGRLRALLTGI